MLKKSLFTAVLLLAVCVPLFSALLIDSAETGTSVNSMGGSWISYSDGVSSVTFTASSVPAYEGGYCRQISMTIIGTTDAYAGCASFLTAGYTAYDASAYYGVRFYAKGAGDIEVKLPITATSADHNHYTVPVTLTDEWELYELRFSDFTQLWGTPQTWDASAITSVGFDLSGYPGTAAEIRIDNLEFYTQAEQISDPDAVFVSLKPKVNQIGYLQSSKKIFTCVTATAGVSQLFEVKRKSDDFVVFTGMTSSGILYDPAAGEGVVTGDFSSFSTQGIYYVEINSQKSFDFEIKNDIYNGLFRDSLRAFYIIRCGCALHDTETGLSHAACHTDDALLADAGGSRSMTGGWHNAGDFGKWAHETAYSAAFMMWLYEVRRSETAALNTGIPESQNGIPDILDEVRWGLEFLLKLQNPDGSVYHKVDSEPNFSWGHAPENDFYTPRSAKPQGVGYTQFSTIDAADFCAVMCQASRVFKSFDPSFADTCKKAALRAWNWIDSNPKTGQADIYYTDTDYTDEVFWATAEMYRTFGDTPRGAEAGQYMDSRGYVHPVWLNPSAFGYWTIWFNPASSETLKSKVQTAVTAACTVWKNNCEASGYRAANAPSEYYWGSSSINTGRGASFIMASIITGNTSWLDYAVYQLDYLCGVNGLEQVFVTGYGTKKNNNPYHWSRHVYNNPLPGWVSGGPNPSPVGADTPLIVLQNKATPPQKCWLDLCSSSGSWASNEGTTDQNAAFVFLAGYFSDTGELRGDGGTDDSLKSIRCYPSPFIKKAGHDTVTFTGLPPAYSIQVFNIKGESVFTVSGASGEGVYVWEIPKGKKMSSGVYVWAVTDTKGKKAAGKMAVIK